MERLKEIYAKELSVFERQRNDIKRLWNISEEAGKFLYRLVEISKPKRILELGTSNGYSTFWLSIACEKHKGEVVSIEVEKSRFELAKKNLIRLKNITLIFDLIEKAIPTLSGKFDMIFIDANKSDYIKYLKLLLEFNKMEIPCLIVADNVISHYKSVKDYLNFVTNNKHFYTEIENIGSGMSLSIYNE